VFGRALAQRELVLAGVALLAAVSALAVASVREAGGAGPGLEPVPAPNGGWYTALASAGGKSFSKERTACGHVVSRDSLGVAHPVLPCDVKLFISYNGREVLTQVIERGPFVPGREFDLTRALARLLDMEGTRQIHWRYAR
jgi:rare lipoprotein A (peptidoglycan hydrolase)